MTFPYHCVASRSIAAGMEQVHGQKYHDETATSASYCEIWFTQAQKRTRWAGAAHECKHKE